jgi:hypothetical protein
MRRMIVAALIVCLFGAGIFWLLCSHGLHQQESRIIEFHSEGETDGFCYITAQLGKALTYARSVKGEQWTCNFLMIGYPAKRLIRKGHSNEELQVHVTMSHEALAPNGKVSPDFDMDFFIYGGRERDYAPVSLGPKAQVGVPNCSDVPSAKTWNTPCRDEDGILVDPFEHPSVTNPSSQK